MKAQPIAELILMTVKRSKLLSKIELRAAVGIREKVLDYQYRDSEGQPFTHPGSSCSIVVQAFIHDVWIRIYDRSYQLDEEMNEDQALRVMLSDLIVEGLVDLKKEYERKIAHNE